MARMVDLMSAFSLPGAGLVARRRFGAARDRGIQHARTALAVELLETRFGAGRAPAAVTGQRAAVQAAGQLTAARQRANVLDFYAAALVAAVFAAKTFLKWMIVVVKIDSFHVKSIDLYINFFKK